MVAGDVAAAEAVVDTVLHLEVIHEEMVSVMLIIWFYRVNKGGWELLQFSHPASIRDDPGPIRDDRRPARHLSWFIKIRTIVPTLKQMMVLMCWRCSIIKWFLTVAWFQALSSCVHVVNLRKVI